MKSVNGDQAPSETRGLSPVEREFVQFFVQMATSLSLPRSVGEIFGYLFASRDPRPFDEVVSGLEISKGSASQGLKFLLKIGAISIAYIPGDRRTFYEAETSMRKVFSEALRESVRPHLESNREMIESIEVSLEREGTLAGDLDSHYESRIASLRNWNEKALQLLPLLTTLFNLKTPASFFRGLRDEGELESPVEYEEPSGFG